jgi:hypothetical protein
MNTGFSASPVILASGLLLVASACATTQQQPSEAERQGDLYYKRGAFHLALPHYERAASQEPENERVSTRLEEARQALFTQRLTTSRESFDQGSARAGIDAFSRAMHELGADYPGMDAFAEEAYRRADSAARAAVSRKDFQNAFELQLLIATEFPDERANAKQQLARIRQQWLDRLEARAHADEDQRLWGSALLTWSKAAQLDREQVKYAEHRERMRERILERYAFQVVMPQDTLAQPASTIAAHLERVRWPEGMKLSLLSEPESAHGVEIATEFGSPVCRASTSVSARQCETIFELELVPFDKRLSSQTVREQLRAEGRDDSAIRNELYTMSARLVQNALEREFAIYRASLVEDAKKIPLQRARIDAEIRAIILAPDLATPARVREIEEVSGFQNTLHLLLHPS